MRIVEVDGSALRMDQTVFGNHSETAAKLGFDTLSEAEAQLVRHAAGGRAPARAALAE